MSAEQKPSNKIIEIDISSKNINILFYDNNFLNPYSREMIIEHCYDYNLLNSFNMI
jgi:hypothetical protein